MILVTAGFRGTVIFGTQVNIKNKISLLAPILSLYNWGGAMFASASQDKTIRLWDLRSRGCVSMISPLTSATSATAKSPVGSVCVDPTGRLLISGHEGTSRKINWKMVFKKSIFILIAIYCNYLPLVYR